MLCGIISGILRRFSSVWVSTVLDGIPRSGFRHLHAYRAYDPEPETRHPLLNPGGRVCENSLGHFVRLAPGDLGGE